MNTINKVEIDELTNKLNEIEMLSSKAEMSIINFGNLLDNNINNGSGIWDGESATQYINSWNCMKEDIPKITEIFKIQSENLKKFINKSIESEEN